MSRHWIEALAPDKTSRQASDFVAECARSALSNYKGHDLTTTQLAEKLWPKAEGDPGYQRQRLFKVLAWLAIRDLADCCHRGDERKRGKQGRRIKEGQPVKTVRPWLWHAPGEPHFEAVLPPTCPHCGGRL